MSLLNDMLNDIDSNNKTPNLSPKATGQRLRPRLVHYGVRYVSVVVIIASLMALAWVLWKKDVLIKESEIAPIPSLKVQASLLPEVPSPSQITPMPALSQQELESLPLDLMGEQSLPVVLPTAPKKAVGSSIVKRFSPLTSTEIKANTYQAAMDSASQGAWELAIAQLSRLLKQYPRYTEAYQSLASFQLHMGQLTAAKKTLKIGIKQENALELVKMYAHILGEEGQYEQALKVLYRLSPPINQEQDYYAMMAVFFEKLGEVEKAGEIYQSLVNIEPGNGAYWLGLAISLEQMERLNSAVKAYTRVLDSYESKPMLQAYAAKRLKMLKG